MYGKKLKQSPKTGKNAKPERLSMLPDKTSKSVTPSKGELALSGVTAYIDVFVDGVNTSSSLAPRLSALGAKVLKRLSTNVTHYIFKDGNTTTLKRAKANVLVVSPSWIQKCDELETHVDETEHLVDRSNLPQSTKKKKGFRPSTSLAVSDPNDSLFSSTQQLQHLTTPVLGFDDDDHSSSDVDAVLERGLGGSRHLSNIIALSPPKPTDKIIKMLRDYDASKDDTPKVESKDVQRRGTRSRKVVTPSPEPEIPENVSEVEEKPTKKIRGRPKKTVSKKKSSEKKKRSKTKKKQFQTESDQEIIEDVRLEQNEDDSEKTEKAEKEKRDDESESTEKSNEEQSKEITDIEKDEEEEQEADQKTEKSKKRKKQPRTAKKPSKRKLKKDLMEAKKTTPKSQKKKTTHESLSQSQSRGRPQRRAVFRKEMKLNLTACSADTNDIVVSTIRALGSCRIVKDLEPCTHLVMEQSSRTLKVLFALARGAWIVSPAWVLTSLENGKWVDEEPFETTNFTGASKSRKWREDGEGGLLENGGYWLYHWKQKEGKDEKSDIPSDVDKHYVLQIYIAENNAPSSEVLQNLVVAGGGKIVSDYFTSDVCIAPKKFVPPTSESSSSSSSSEPPKTKEDEDTELHPEEEGKSAKNTGSKKRKKGSSLKKKKASKKAKHESEEQRSSVSILVTPDWLFDSYANFELQDPTKYALE